MNVDLASRTLGGSVVAASDESFGFKERLIDPSEPLSSQAYTTSAVRSSTAGKPPTRRRRLGDRAARPVAPGCMRSTSTPASSPATNRPEVASRPVSSIRSPSRPRHRAVDDGRRHRRTEIRLPQRLDVDDPRRYMCGCSWNPTGESRDYGPMATSSSDPALWDDVTVEMSRRRAGRSRRMVPATASISERPRADRGRPATQHRGDGWETRRLPRYRPRHPHDAVIDLVCRARRSAARRGDRHQPLRVQRLTRRLRCLAAAASPLRGTRLGALVPFDVRSAWPHPHRTPMRGQVSSSTRHGHHRPSGAGLSRTEVLLACGPSGARP